MEDGKRRIERIIAKAGLTQQETMVARVYYGSGSAGKRTKKWVQSLSPRKYVQLLMGVQNKVEPLLRQLEVKG